MWPRLRPSICWGDIKRKELWKPAQASLASLALGETFLGQEFPTYKLPMFQIQRRSVQGWVCITFPITEPPAPWPPSKHVVQARVQKDDLMD